MNEKYDLHCHSTASDGALSPTELVKRAQQQGVTVLALTDHDTVDGLAEARQAAAESAIRLIDGIELSAGYKSQCLHIVGLNIDPNNTTLLTGLAKQQDLRAERAKKIADKLEKNRIYGAYDAVIQSAKDGMVTRSHFADFLVSEGHVSTQQEAFDRYLAQGKPAFVCTEWATLEETVNWIKEAGGIAVLAHPTRYKCTASWMNRALTAFKALGGQAIEVATGRANADEINTCHRYAQKYQLHGSAGSDFHSPEFPWLELGRISALPKSLPAVWELF